MQVLITYISTKDHLGQGNKSGDEVKSGREQTTVHAGFATLNDTTSTSRGFSAVLMHMTAEHARPMGEAKHSDSSFIGRELATSERQWRASHRLLAVLKLDTN